jgi:tetratricopeptide (TPR) repeat protein
MSFSSEVFDTQNLNREIRVFLSSTFKDMDEERRYLVEQVFPQVRQACAQRQVVFTEIDLRWGITEEEAKNGRTVEICLEEIDRSRNSPPFFIGFLGERYGWIPTREDLQTYLDHNDSPYAEKIASALEQGISVTELEMQHAFLSHKVDSAHARIFLRSQALTDQLYQAEPHKFAPHEFYDAAEGKLDTLKNQLRSAEHDVMGIDGYQDVAEFGEAVKDFLLESLDSLYPDQPRTALDRYQDSQAIYAQSRLAGYVPLVDFTQQVIDSLKQTQEDNQMRHVHIHGESGLGKSAFVAHLSTQLPTKMGAQVLPHFVGADTSASPEGWRDQLMMRLRHGLEQTQESLASDEPSELEQEALSLDGSKDAWDAFYDLLAQYQQQIQQPVVLLLDAINQMHGVTQLYEKFNPIYLPEDVFLVTTSIETYPLPLTKQIEFPKLNSELIQSITQTYLADYQKTLPPEVESLLTDAKPCQNALFLKTLLEELRLLGRHETLLEQARAMIALKTPARLFEQTLNDIDAYAAQNGVPIHPAKQIMQYINLTYRGLTQHQLKQLVSKTSDVELQDAHLAPVLARLHNFLLLEQGRFRVMHSAFALPVTQDEIARRQAIIEESDKSTTIGLLETLHQYTQANQQAEVTAILGEHLFEMFEADERLFAEALALIGAGEAQVNAYVQTLMDMLKQSLSSSLLENIDRLSIFLLKNSFSNLVELMLKKHLENDLRVLPEGHPGIANSLNTLAMLYQEHSRLDEAEPLYKEALEIYRNTLKEDHLAIATILGNLAGLYKDQNQLEKAEPLYKEALTIRQEVLPAAHPDIATVLNNLAEVYQGQKLLDEAEHLYQKALAIRQQALPEVHTDIALSLSCLASFYREQNKLAKAEHLAKKALEIYQNALPARHPSIATSLNNLALIYQSQGHVDKAESLYKKALEIYQDSLPVGHPYIFNTLYNLEMLCQDQDRLDKAEFTCKVALAMRKSCLPESHPEIASNLNRLAVLYQKQKHLDEAEPLYQEAIAILRNSQIVEYPNLANALSNLAELYKEKNLLDKSESLYVEALEIYHEAYPREHLDMASVLNKLAGIYQKKNQMNKMEPLLQKAYTIYQRFLPADHPHMSISLMNLAWFYGTMGKVESAETYYYQLLSLKLLFRASNEEIMALLTELAKMYVHNGYEDTKERTEKILQSVIENLDPGKIKNQDSGS